MNKQQFNKWFLELCTQEYKGNINALGGAINEI